MTDLVFSIFFSIIIIITSLYTTGAAFETDIRKEQFEREKAAKETARQTKDTLKDVNMAKAAFG